MSEYKFFNVVPYYPGHEEETAGDLIELYQRTGINRILYSLSFHPEGKNAMEKAERLVASFRKLRDALAKEPAIKCGVLIQSILGHVIAQRVEMENWTYVITHNGKQEGSGTRFCSFDPGFSNYIRKVGAMVAAEKPFFILGDDDIRSWSAGVECFCELHTAEYNRRHGTDFTPDEYRVAVCESDVNSEIYRNFDKLREDTVNRVASLLREGIDSVDPSIPGGSCMPGGEYFFNQDTARCLGAREQSETVMRICNANYVENSPRDFAANAFKSQAYRKYHRGVHTVLDESDTFPHSLFSKSAISFHAKECSAIFNGLNGAKLWFVNCRRPGVVISRKYTDILAKYRNFYPALSAAVADSTACGVRIPIHTGKDNWHAITNRLPNITPANSWSEYLGIFGIPFSAEIDYDLGGVYAIRGREFVDRKKDEELLTLLKGKLLVDGAAAMALTERGFAKYLGVEAKKPSFPFTSEAYVDGNDPIYCRTWKDAPELIPLTDKLQVLTHMKYSPFMGCPEPRIICPGSVLFNNELGGTVCTTVFCTTDEFTPRGGVPRKEWLFYLLDKIDAEAVKGSSLAEQPVMSLTRQMNDGGKLVMLCNLGFDALDDIELKFPGASKVEILSADGKWEAADAKVSGETLVIAKPVACYEVVIIKIK